MIICAGCNSAYRLRYWNFAHALGHACIFCCNSAYRLRYWNVIDCGDCDVEREVVATVPTACGIETIYSKHNSIVFSCDSCNSAYRLRYWNPVNKLTRSIITCCNSAYRLRYWNFACAITEPSPVICCNSAYRLRYWNSDTLYPINIVITSCNSAYRLRYWNTWVLILSALPNWRCNSAYRLRYWNLSNERQPITRPCSVATVPTSCGIETSAI